MSAGRSHFVYPLSVRYGEKSGYILAKRTPVRAWLREKDDFGQRTTRTLGPLPSRHRHFCVPPGVCEMAADQKGKPP